MDDGTAHDLAPGDVVDIPAGHDGWVVGDEQLVIYDIAGPRGWGKPPALGDRILTTLLFTDIVDSTPLAQRLGDARWKDLLASYYMTTRLQLDHFRGHLITTTGDGVLANFDSPARAIRCAESLVGAFQSLELQIRAGVHTGEVEVISDNVRGLTVHIAARVMQMAGPDQILVSSTSRQLASGSGLNFDDLGEHLLKGVAESWRLFSVASA